MLNTVPQQVKLLQKAKTKFCKVENDLQVGNVNTLPSAHISCLCTAGRSHCEIVGCHPAKHLSHVPVNK